MIITVNKSIIDTEKICQITKIKQFDCKFCFEIYFYNTVMPLYVEKYFQVITRTDAEVFLDAVETDKFKKMYKELVDFWSNNQSNLPNFQF
jgi:hypothetical protein